MLALYLLGHSLRSVKGGCVCERTHSALLRSWYLVVKQNGQLWQKIAMSLKCWSLSQTVTQINLYLYLRLQYFNINPGVDIYIPQNHTQWWTATGALVIWRWLHFFNVLIFNWCSIPCGVCTQIRYHCQVVKQEILREMRKEINKAKQEIIDGEGYSKRSLFLHTLHSQYFFVSVIRLELSRR